MVCLHRSWQIAECSSGQLFVFFLHYFSLWCFGPPRLDTHTVLRSAERKRLLVFSSAMRVRQPLFFTKTSVLRLFSCMSVSYSRTISLKRPLSFHREVSSSSLPATTLSRAASFCCHSCVCLLLTPCPHDSSSIRTLSIRLRAMS